MTTYRLPGTPPRGAAEATARVQPRADETGAFAIIGEAAPRFAESYVGKLPPPPRAPPPPASGTVPANPFSEISDGAIEYFVEWSMEQSTAAHPKSKPPANATFANVPMMPPRADHNVGASAARLRLYIGIVVGLALGIPLGAAGMWSWRPMFAPQSEPIAPKVSVAPVAPRPIAAAPPVEAPPVEPTPAVEEPAPAPVKPPEAPRALAKVVERPKANPPRLAPPKHELSRHELAEPAKPEPPKPEAPRPELAKPEAETPKPAAPEEAASPGPAELPPPPSLGAHHAKTGTLRVRSTPPGAEVLIKGEPHGNTPIDIELPPNHRYDITIVSPGKPPWRKRINLKPPLTEISASFK